MSLIKWIHLSDIHIKSKARHLERYNSEVVLTNLWKDIDRRANINPELDKIDFAFITGDIAWSGGDEKSEDEYHEFYERVVKPLADHANLNIDDIFIVPGNHDVARSAINDKVIEIEKRITGRDSINELFIEPDREEDRHKILFRLNNYSEFILSKMHHIPLDLTKCTFTIQKETKCFRIPCQIVGLNSALMAKGGEDDKGALSIGECIINGILERFDNEMLTIVLIHHPFNGHGWYKTFEETTINQIKAFADFILCGHVHKSSILSQLDTTGPLIKIVGGSIYENREWLSNSYNYVLFNISSGDGNVFLRRYVDSGPSGPEWMKDIVATGDALNGVLPIKLISPSKIENFDRSYTQSVKDFLLQFVNLQSEELSKRPLLSDSYPDRDSMDILFPEVYVDPLVRPRRHPSDPILLSQWLKSNFDENKKVLLLGGAGTGKTTSLIQINSLISQKYLSTSENGSPLPVFLEARTYDWNSPLLQENLILHVFHNIGLEGGELLVDKQFKTFALIDALDEAFPSVYQELGHVNLELLELNFPHISTCRLDFFERNLSGAEFCSKYDEILELEPWELDREVKDFLNSYFDKIVRPPNSKVKSREILDYINNIVSEVHDFPITPLSVTSILFLWLYNQEILRTRPITSFALLLEIFINLWAEREVSIQKSIFYDKVQLVRLYENAAWVLFQNKDKSHLPLKEFAVMVASLVGIEPTFLEQDRGFLSLLRLRRDIINRAVLNVVSFVHEALYEFLIANKIVSSLSSHNNWEIILSHLFGFSIQKLAREILLSLNDNDKSKIVYILRGKYYSLAKLGDNVNYLMDYPLLLIKFKFSIYYGSVLNLFNIKELYNVVVIRDNICYYWGRLEADLGGILLRELYRDIISGKFKEHPVVKGTIGTGILLTNDADMEETYLTEISNGSVDDIRNRTYHRVYYGDSTYYSPDTFLRDDGTFGIEDWIKTRGAILRRMASSDSRSQALRALDIVTFIRLCETRGVPVLKEEEINILRNPIKDLLSLPPKKVDIIKREHTKLLKIIGK